MTKAVVSVFLEGQKQLLPQKWIQGNSGNT